MKHFINSGHCQFDLLVGGTVQQVIGKMIHCDQTGVTIVLENNGETHAYAFGVVQHICLAP